MKKLLPLLLLILIGCSQQPVEDSTLIEKDGLMYIPDSDNPYSGETFFDYITGETEYKGTYEEGILISESYLNKDGTKKEPIDVFNMLIERNGVFYTKNFNQPYSGPVVSLHPNGEINSEVTVKRGKPHGPIRYYFQNGQLFGEGTYKDGKEDGPFKTYYENGQIQLEVTYKDGELIDSENKVSRYFIHSDDTTTIKNKDNEVKDFDLLNDIDRGFVSDKD